MRGPATELAKLRDPKHAVRQSVPLSRTFYTMRVQNARFANCKHSEEFQRDARIHTKLRDDVHICEPSRKVPRTERARACRRFTVDPREVGFSAKDKHMLKYSVAIAALLISAPVAFAQGAGEAKQGSEGMSRSGPGMSQSDSGGSKMKSGSRSQENTGGSSGASSGSSGSDSSASDYAPGQRKGSGSAKEYAPGQTKTEGSARDNAPGHRKDQSDKMDKRSESKTNARDADKNADRGDRKSENNARNDKERDHNERNANRDHSKDEGRAGDHNRASTGTSEGTEGRSSAGRGSVASVTTEQKTRIKTVFTRHHVEPARNLNVSVNVGVRLPHSVRLYPVPEDVIAIVPAYRDYMYVMLDDDRVAIIDPDSYEVVDIVVLA